MEAPPHVRDESSLLGLSTPWTRAVVPLSGVVGAAGVALWVEGASEPRAWLTGVAALVLGIVGVRRRSRVERALFWGAAMVLASLGPHAQSSTVDAFGAIGAMVCAGAACAAIAAIPPSGGVANGTPASPVASIVAVIVLWCLALAARLAPPSGSLSWMTDYPGPWAIGAAAGSVLLLLAQAERTLRRRGIELGLTDRVLALRALLGTSIATVEVLGVLGGGQASALARLVVALASAVVTAAALYPDAVGVARATRRVVVLTIAGGAVALVGAAATGGGADWEVVVFTAAVAIVVGANAPALEAPLRPENGKWLDAFGRASDEALRARPDDVVREVLQALRAPGGLSSPSPELFTFMPPAVTKVDAAGYMHERNAELPEALVAAAACEPESTLRADVLDRLVVRRPELRPFAKWMADRDALLVTVVAHEGEAEGLLVLPRVGRSQAATLEEVRALKRVADRLASACRARAAQVGALARATEANGRAEAAEQEVERLLHERALDAGRDALATARLARPATVGGYSVVSRMALEALERRASVGAPIAVVAPSGVDPVPYLARAHLAGVRRSGPLVVVDATSAREHDLERWSDPSASPMALADRGMLVLLDGAALPGDVQQLVARALAERRAPWDRPAPLDVQLAFTGVVSPEKLAAEGRLDASLALRLADACGLPIALPPLRDRIEDLRAIITDRLAREGLRVLGRPVGIEQTAYARLIEHVFPGDDAELGLIAQRLVVRCRGDVVRAADVDALRLSAGGGRSAGSSRGSSGRRKSPLSA